MDDIEILEENKINCRNDSSLELIEIYKKIEEYIEYLNSKIIVESEEV